MVSFRVFSNAPVTRSFASTPRARRAWRQEGRRVAAEQVLAVYRHEIARVNQDQVNRDAGERARQEANYHFQLAADQDHAAPPAPPSSTDAPPVIQVRRVRRRVRGHAEDAPVTSLQSIPSTGSAPLSWGPRRPAPGAPNPVRTQARDVSPIRRMPPLSSAQRRLFNSPPSSPMQDPNPPSSPGSMYSPTAPSTGPVTPIGSVRPFLEEPFTPGDPSYSPTPAQPYSPPLRGYQPEVLPSAEEVIPPIPPIMWHGALDINDFADRLATLRVAACTDITDGSQLFPIDLTVEGSKENPIEL
jgi:hypothetical protein